MKLVMDFQIDGDTARVGAVAFDDWGAAEGTKNYALRIEHVEKAAKGELDLRALPWLVQLLDANRLQPEAIVLDGFVHLDPQDTPGLGLRLHDTLGGRSAVIGVSKSVFKGTDTGGVAVDLEVHDEFHGRDSRRFSATAPWASGPRPAAARPPRRRSRRRR